MDVLHSVCAPVHGFVKGVLYRLSNGDENGTVFSGFVNMEVYVTGGDLPCGDPVYKISKRIYAKAVLDTNRSVVPIYVEFRH